jgi:hypothetical protein
MTKAKKVLKVIERTPIEEALHSMQHNRSLELDLYTILEEESEDCIIHFFSNDLWGVNLDKLKNKFINLKINYSIVEDVGGDEDEFGSAYYKVVKFYRHDEVFYVKFDGYYASYDGSTFQRWFFVKPSQKTIIVYE